MAFKMETRQQYQATLLNLLKENKNHKLNSMLNTEHILFIKKNSQ